MVLLIASAIVLIIIFILLLFFRTRIRIAIELIEEAAIAVSGMMSTLFFPIIPFVLVLVYFISQFKIVINRVFL
jgi:choline transporter-like protein 2/4/5